MLTIFILDGTSYIWFETKFDDKSKNYVIGVIYRHPNCVEEGLDYFSQQFEKNMKVINKEKKKCILTGDINIDGLKLSKNKHVENFFKTVLQQYFIPTITKPTRIQEDRNGLHISLIDHIFINSETVKKDVEIITGNIFSDITDHLPSFITIKSHKKFEKQHRPNIRIYGEKNTATFKTLLADADWTEFYNSQDENKALGIFIPFTMNHLRRHFL